jgi:hypothetical protein
MLASGPPGTLDALNLAARTRLQNSLQINPPPQPTELFSAPSGPEDEAAPTQTLNDLLNRCRALLGACLGCEALRMYAIIVRGTHHLRWSGDGDLAQSLAIVDGDIAQAIQSCKEQVESLDRRSDTKDICSAAEDLTNALRESERLAETWNGEFPFVRALDNVTSWLKSIR